MQDDKEEKTLSQEEYMRSTSNEPDEKEQELTEESLDTVKQDDEEELEEKNLFPKYGCLRGCLIPIIAIIIIITAIVMLIQSKSDAIHDWLIVRIISNTQKKILNDLPEGIDKKTIELTFDKLRSAIKNNKIDEQEIKNAIKEFLQAIEGPTTPENKKIEIDRLIKRLNKSLPNSE
ncbi:MAG: hypothetical protein ACPL7B_02795 [Candidatus Poribacteria bacterium]